MKRNMKKVWGLLLTASMCVGLAGCGNDSQQVSQSGQSSQDRENTQSPGGQESQSGESGQQGFLDHVEGLPETLDNPDISIVYWYNRDQYAYDTSKNENVYDPILEAIPYFEEKYGGKVNVIYAAWGDMLATVTAQQHSGDAPDLFEVYDETMYSVILSGGVTPLDAFTTDADYSYYDVDKELFSWKDSVYAIPLKPYTRYIMFNKDLFDLEGMKSPDQLFLEGNWNWSTFRDACRQLTKTTDGETSQMGYGSHEESILWFMWANGGSLLNVDTASGTVSSNLGSAPVQNTLNYLIEIRDSLLWNREDNMWGWFDNGLMGMICGKEYPVDLPFDTGMVPFPVGDDYSGKNKVVYPQAMAVPSGAKNPQGAVAFMRIVNELQKVVGDQKEANRIGQENYDMIYGEDVKTVYAYDKGLDDIQKIVSEIVNYMSEGVPASTINSTMDPVIQAQIDLMYK